MNLQPLPRELNSSKGAKIETGTEGWKMYVKESKEISPKYRENLERRQRAIIGMVEKEIEKRGL
ncbi:hypothetical protein A6A11_04155 [Bisgaardia hudsonensis]|uniref:hypothetical protein n=1 Tax=Bisgaardia hudsonensis TaxID=109472 RepID=UPI00105081BB|nr:hypothetical protein [Bisgaardia hudsonensis]QLB12855.1 hypothetical protein A6A11_04155 [Bisgaardia hudsonensis]